MSTGIALGAVIAQSVTFGANEFLSTGGPTCMINLSSGSPDFRVDISAGTYGGTPFTELPLATYFGTLENGNKITGQKVNGMVYYVPNHIYVRGTSPNNNLQTAINFASGTSRDIIVVQGSSTVRNESVTINKPVELQGAQYGNSVTERTPTPSNSNESKWRNASGTTPIITLGPGANNVKIDGFSLYANTTSGYGIYQNTPLSGLVVSNNFIRNFSQLGVSIATGSDGFTVEKKQYFGQLRWSLPVAGHKEW